MSKILLVCPSLSPPWDHGIKVYANGLRNAIDRIDDMHVSVTDLSPTNDDNVNYDFVHIVSRGLGVLRLALRRYNEATLFKHIITPSIGLGNLVSTSVLYAALNTTTSVVTKCFSSEFVARSYHMKPDIVIPPAIDTSVYRNSKEINSHRVLSIFEKSPISFGVNNMRKSSDGLIFYSGPLNEHRFPYKRVLKTIKDLKLNILIIDRHADHKAEAKVREIKAYSEKLGLENQVSVVAKILSEDEKIDIMNYSDVVIQPFSKRIKNLVAVDPPIFLLESMACCKPVITSDSYSFRSVIRNGSNGYVVDWNNSEEIQDSFTACLSNNRIGLNARNTILQEFSLETVSETIRRMYDKFQ